ncbi:MAG TPA: DR2241 family protein [Verrucomicrobiae bacterium]|nr:DR2241 family protein [Verrucomicrobiae bacterium]
MSVIENPALKHFAASIGLELVVAQVLIRRAASGYELRHGDDRAAGRESLRAVALPAARALAQYTSQAVFRPLKSAPNLQAGWRLVTVNDAELEMALNHLYPGAIADWHAAEEANPPVTDYREFTNRQSGMYRVTAMLSDAQVAEVVKTTCDSKCCLKRRLWTAPGVGPDSAAEKSLIPCLEPCAILLETARQAMRLEQREKMDAKLVP